MPVLLADRELVAAALHAEAGVQHGAGAARAHSAQVVVGHAHIDHGHLAHVEVVPVLEKGERAVVHVQQHAHLIPNRVVAAVERLRPEGLRGAVVEQPVPTPAAGLTRRHTDEDAAPAGRVHLHLPVVHAPRKAPAAQHHGAPAARAIAGDGGKVGRDLRAAGAPAPPEQEESLLGGLKGALRLHQPLPAPSSPLLADLQLPPHGALRADLVASVPLSRQGWVITRSVNDVRFGHLL
mmetsp:Transcript_15237/g.33612  ORF Transcript_15237/g.33612 Transcript_15237/m.33612 type:complete len:237 (-) Transcript_15237:2502-3212(-)